MRLIEIFVGGASTFRECSRRGHVAIHLGWPYGQDIYDAKSRRLVMALIDYLEPEDVLVSWPCKFWSSWQRLNMARNEAAYERVMTGRAEGRVYLKLFRKIWRRQTRRGRHCTSENPFGSSCFLGSGFFSNSFNRVAWWCDMDQRGTGLSPPYGDKTQRHTKRTCFVTTRPELRDPLGPLKCDEVCRLTYDHVPLSGSWPGRNLTSWAEDYPKALARLLCDGMNIEFITLGSANPLLDASVDADMSFQLENMFDAIAPGTYSYDDLNAIERNEVELFTDWHPGPRDPRAGLPYDFPFPNVYLLEEIFVRAHPWSLARIRRLCPTPEQ